MPFAQKIVTGFCRFFEPCHGESGREILCKLIGGRDLDFPSARYVDSTEFCDVQRYGNNLLRFWPTGNVSAQSVPNPFRIDPPLCCAAIGWQAGMQVTAGRPVLVINKPSDYGTEAFDIEVGIF